MSKDHSKASAQAADTDFKWRVSAARNLLVLLSRGMIYRAEFDNRLKQELNLTYVAVGETEASISKADLEGRLNWAESALGLLHLGVIDRVNFDARLTKLNLTHADIETLAAEMGVTTSKEE